MLTRRILCCCLIPFMAVFPLLSSGCGQPRKISSDPLPLDGTAHLNVGDYVEVETLEGEYFFAEITDLSEGGFSVGSKDSWDYRPGPAPRVTRGKRHYQFTDLSQIRIATPEQKPMSTEMAVLLVSVGLVVAFVWVMFLALSNMPND